MLNTNPSSQSLTVWKAESHLHLGHASTTLYTPRPAGAPSPLPSYAARRMGKAEVALSWYLHAAEHNPAGISRVLHTPVCVCAREQCWQAHIAGRHSILQWLEVSLRQLRQLKSAKA